MAIAAPIILLPTEGADYATDVAYQTISGTTVPETASIKVNDSVFGVSYTAGDTIWAWSGVLPSGVTTLNIVAVEKLTNIPSLPVTINITYVLSDQFITVAPPTGVKLREYQDKIEVVNSQNIDTQTLGYNYYVSTQSGGVYGSYVKINKTLVTDYSFFEDKTKEINRTVDTAGNIRVTTITEELNRVYYYSTFFDETIFNAMVSAGLLPPVTYGEDTPFFFVVSAQIYDPVLGQVTESAFSSELEGSPITITTGIKDLPGRSQNDIILTFSQELLVSNAGIDTKPGTVIRDMMNPISEEMARTYIIQNFIARSLSVSTILDFDDANKDGVSDSVSSSTSKSALKIALNLTNDYDVQRVIDDQFDKLAANVNVIRKPASPAVGSVVFYVASVPIRDMTVNEGAMVTSVGDLDQGIPSQSYKVMSTKTLEYKNKEQYYNTQTGRYEITMDVEALSPGAAGNTDSYTIKTISTGVDTDFRVENPSPISFGEDKETNHDLATRIELAFFVDTGTEGGYARVTVGITGVRKVKVEKAGDPLMIRDYDPVRNKHVGGKVDIYVQGRKTHQVTDQIAFAFGSVSGTEGTLSAENFLVLNAQSFQFKSQNPRVSAHTPIFEVTRVYNSTKAKEYDLTGYMIIGDGDTIDLDETRQINAAIGLASADIIKVDYKYRSSDTFIMSHQPVTSVVSVVGQISGTLPPENYELVTLQDTLGEGSSTIATDGVRIIFVNNLPLSEFQTIADEQHVLILEKEEPLNFLGADPESIVVKNSDKTVTYVENVDYRIIPGTDIVATAILIMETGGIENGQLVLISYTAIENFIITYTTNELLSEVQTEVDRMKHACADVIVKQAVENKVNFAFTIIPKTGVTNTNLLSTKIGTAIGNYVTQLGIGNALTQSAVVHAIQSIADVDYVVVPFSRMVKADGSFIVRDHIGLTQFEIFNEGLARAYISSVAILSYTTIDKGGTENKFRGIFEDTMPLMLQSDPLDVSGGPGRGYIREDGKIVVSTIDGALPDSKSYEVAYYVYGETGSKDINVASIENLVVGTLTIVYDQPRDLMQTL
jgi:hypothetical protein